MKFPQTTLHGEALAQYFQYEENYLKCSEDVILASETDPSKGQIGVDVVKRIYWKARLQPLPAALTLASVIFDMNAQLIAEEMERTSLLQKALDEDLGFYTTEQEADFLALQWVALLGLDPGAAREFWLEYLQAAPEQDSPYNFGYERCDAAYHQSPRWTQSGQRLGVPYGSFAQIHPGKCHRVYQIDKRLGAVSFTVGRRRSTLNEVL